jgi:hypothetical protein
MAWGASETPPFLRQSRTFAAAWRAAGNPTIELEMPGHHHFSIMEELAKPEGPMVKAMLSQMGLA